jgi:hypothetical protein
MDENGAVDMAGISTFKKGPQPKVGPAYGTWGTERPPIEWTTLPGTESIIGFDLSALTLQDYEAMRHHPQLHASLAVLSFMIHQTDWHVVCEDKKIQSMVEENVSVIWTRLVRAMGTAFWAGRSPNVLEFENDPQGKYVVVNKIKDLPVMECDVHWKKVKRSLDGKLRQFNVYDGIDQWGYGEIPVMNSYWYPLLMENGDYSGRKLMKAAFMPWYFSLLMHLFTNRYFERFGEPLPIGRAPFEDEIVEPDGTRISGKQIMEQIVTNIRNRGAIVLPSDRDASTGTGAQSFLYDVDYLESQMRGVDFERYLSRLDEEMSLAMFTPLLLMKAGDSGSNNLGVQHTQTWLWCINAILGDMKEYIDRYICERLKGINFSEKAPRCEWVPKKLGKESVETTRAITTELIRQGQITVDLDQLGEAMGIDVKKIRQITDPTAGVTPAQAVDPLTGDQTDVRNRTERQRSTDNGQKVASGGPTTDRKLAARIRDDVVRTWGNKVDIKGLDTYESLALGDEAGRVDTLIRTLNGLDSSEFDTVESFMNVVRGRLASVGA